MLRQIGSHAELLPPRLAGVLSRMSFALSGRPHASLGPERIRFGNIEILPFKDNCKGALCLSADFEMAWAWQYARTKPSVDFALRERENVPRIIALFERYSIPISWATVGHLFLESCTRGPNGLAHPTMLRPSHFANREWVFQRGDWYQNDPCTDYKKSPTWYAPDLIDLIMGSTVKHEIGTHTFSHIDFSTGNCSRDLAVQELEASVEAMKKHGLSPRSIVFPAGTLGNYDVPSEFGIIAMRGRQLDPRVELSYPDRHNGFIWNIASSLALEKRKHWSTPYSIWRTKRYIERAIKLASVCHFWFHPSFDPEVIDIILPSILHYAHTERAKGNLWVATMEEIAQYCEARETTSVTMRETSIETSLKLTPNEGDSGTAHEITLCYHHPGSKIIESIEDGRRHIPYVIDHDPSSGWSSAIFSTANRGDVTIRFARSL